MKKVAWVLVIIGALNWGLVGLGGLFFGGEINLVSMIFGMTDFAYIVYILVGLSAVYVAMGYCSCENCRGLSCKNCANGTCDVHKKPNGQM